MRFIAVIAFCLTSCLAWANDNWTNPRMPVKYDFSGDKLEKAWPMLTRGSMIPFPTGETVRRALEKKPDLKDKLPIVNNDYDAYAKKLQDAFRMLYEGDLKGAKKAGMALGPAGLIPAMYAQIYYAMHVAQTEDEKQALLKEAIRLNEEGIRLLSPEGSKNVSADVLKTYPELVFAWFGVNYAKSRYTEDLGKVAAIGTGYVGDMKKGLEKLVAVYPQHTFSVATLGGIHAGIIDKSGAMMASMTYGAKAEKMEDYFRDALRQQPDLAVVHKEYAVAMMRAYGDDAKDKAVAELQKAISLQPKSSVEALEQATSRKLLAKYQQN